MHIFNLVVELDKQYHYYLGRQQWERKKKKKKSLPGFHSGSFVGSDPNIVPQNITFISLSLLLFLELGSLLKFRAFILGNVTFKVSNAINFAICMRPSGLELIKFKFKLHILVNNKLQFRWQLTNLAISITHFYDFFIWVCMRFSGLKPTNVKLQSLNTHIGW